VDTAAACRLGGVLLQVGLLLADARRLAALLPLPNPCAALTCHVCVHCTLHVCSGVEELERDICFILGLLAIKVEHQQAICKHGALPTLVAMIKRYAGKNDIHLSGIPAQTCRRTADAITNLAHENNDIKNKVRQEGGVPPLVSLLHSIDPKVQRAVAGSLRTLAFKNEDNKQIIVELGSLPLLIQMLRAEDSTIHYEAVGVIGNLVHSSPAIKRRVLEEGALQPVINLLSSPCPDSQREAALLLGQFATGGWWQAACLVGLQLR
jgi:hypothetical protein